MVDAQGMLVANKQTKVKQKDLIHSNCGGNMKHPQGGRRWGQEPQVPGREGDREGGIQPSSPRHSNIVTVESGGARPLL